VEIEEVAPPSLTGSPSAVNAVKGVDLATARSIAEQGHLPAEVLDAAAVTISKLWEVFVAETPPWSRSTRCAYPLTR